LNSGGNIERESCLRRREDFNRVLSTGRSRADNYLVLKMVSGTRTNSRVGLVTSKKVGGAVQRNRVRRRLREIIRPMAIRPGVDLVIIARSSTGLASFDTLETSVRGLFKRAGLVETENEKTGS
jgi:ribonuclease P protein component